MHAPDPAPWSGLFEPSCRGGEIETAFLLESLTEFYDDQLISDILFKVKGGKEANVYACQAGPALTQAGHEIVASKLYRPEAFRAMKNDGLYRLGREERSAEGKAIRDKRALRAMHKRTRQGRAMRSASWIHHEYATLQRLLDAGVAVPQPLAMSERVILMEFIGDETGAAPTLADTALDDADAQRIFDVLITDVARMLDAGHIHGDLSAYNVLCDQGEPVVIDLPQTVDPYTHPQAFTLLSRDIENLCRYFSKQGVDRDPMGLTAELWEAWVHR
ncbi:MAG: RIO1 family regulatory kinase/ATPase [Planctomycetota bacterium]